MLRGHYNRKKAKMMKKKECFFIDKKYAECKKIDFMDMGCNLSLQ